jgi:sulfoxide reductase catalytic subunit YedY
MLIKMHNDGFNHLIGSEITPQGIYTGRRDLMKLMAGGVAGAAMAGWASREAHAMTPKPGKLAALASTPSKIAGGMALDKLTDYKDAST